MPAARAIGLPLHSFYAEQDCHHPSHWKASNPFLFRVWAEGIYTHGDTIRLDVHDGFVSHAFEKWRGSTLRKMISASRARTHGVLRSSIWDKETVVLHVDRRNRAEYSTLTPYVSASFSIMWAIWNALRWLDNKPQCAEEIRISVIRLGYFEDTPGALTIASKHLEKRPKEHAAWAFATRAQEVLVYGRIPAEAVLSTVSLSALRKSLPPWMFDLSALPPIVDHSGKERRATAKAYAVEWGQRMRAAEISKKGSGAQLALKLALGVLDEPLAISRHSGMRRAITQFWIRFVGQRERKF